MAIESTSNTASHKSALQGILQPDQLTRRENSPGSGGGTTMVMDMLFKENGYADTARIQR
jgi:hypothetical protein